MSKRSYSTQPCGDLFVVVDHPDKLKDKALLKEKRRHVMHHYLEKERLNPNTRDPRVLRQNSKKKPRGNTRSRVRSDADAYRPTRSPFAVSRSSISSVRSANDVDVARHTTSTLSTSVPARQSSLETTGIDAPQRPDPIFDTHLDSSASMLPASRTSLTPAHTYLFNDMTPTADLDADAQYAYWLSCSAAETPFDPAALYSFAVAANDPTALPWLPPDPDFWLLHTPPPPAHSSAAARKGMHDFATDFLYDI